MQQFDTLKIGFSGSAIRGGSSDIWVETQKTDLQTGEISTSMQVKSNCLPIGVSAMSTGRDREQYQLTFSAKVLGNEYLQGISIQNWDRVIDKLHPIIQLDRNVVFDTGMIFTCDSTNNLEIEDIGYKHSQVYSALLSGRSNLRFLPVSYHSQKKQGIEFRGVQTEKNRMIVYSKHLDLLKPANRDFLSSVNASKMIEQSMNQVRFEVNHTTLNSIRKRFSVNDNNLQSVLTSSAPVNYDFLKKILGGSDIKQTSLFSEWEYFQSTGGKGFDFILLKGVQSLINELDCNDILVKNLFQSIFENTETFKHHWYRKKNSIRSILQSEKQKRFSIVPNVADQIINRVLENLKKAVA
jgi:hypothetical protein